MKSNSLIPRILACPLIFAPFIAIMLILPGFDRFIYRMLNPLEPDAITIPAGTSTISGNSSADRSITSPTEPAVDPLLRARVAETYGNLPLSFEANQGQTAAAVKFLSRGEGYTLFLKANEAVLSLSRTPDQKSTPGFSRAGLPPSGKSSVIRLKLLGASANPRIVGMDPLPGKSNYFIGNDPAKWHTDIPQHSRVKYCGIYPGIDLVYYGRGRQLEFDFELAPGADPRKIRFNYDGADHAGVNDDGDLVLAMDGEKILLHKPLAYQQEESGRKEIQAGLKLGAGNTIRFTLDNYDDTKPLTIDPILSYSTYLGGSSYQQAMGIAVDSGGNAYLVGSTTSSDFPTTNAVFQRTMKGTRDIFVAKLNPAGNALVFSTFLGGGGEDWGNAIAIDAAGNIVAVGDTGSTDFPTTAAAPQTANRGGMDICVSKIGNLGNQLIYSTYLGGSGWDYGYGVAIDSNGNALVAGDSSSSDFPIQNAIQPNKKGYDNGIIAKLNAGGTALIFSTFLGGSSSDTVYGIAVDPTDNAYVTGITYSSDFPTTAGAFQIRTTGAPDAFVAKLAPSGQAISYSTYLGGSAADYSYGIAVDGSGNAYVAGRTYSANFPVTADAFQAKARIVETDDNQVAGTPSPTSEANADALNGPSDGYVAKLNSSGTGLLYSTFLGGAEDDQATAITLDGNGGVVVTGITWSPDFPEKDPVQSEFGSTFGVYFTNNSGSSWSLRSGGLPARTVTALAIDPTDPDIAYAGLPNKGVYKTVNGGIDWNVSNAGIEYIYPTIIVINSRSPNTLYAVSGGLWKSTDAGSTWKNINPTGSGWVGCVAIDPNTPTTIYAGGNSSSKDAVFKSQDEGNSWGSPITVGVTINTFGLSAIALDPSNSSTVYSASNGGTYKSTDAGANWSKIESGHSASNLIINPIDPRVLYLNAYDGVFKSSDGGAGWSRMACCYSSMVMDPSNPSVLYGAAITTMGRKVNKSTDGGVTWADAWGDSDRPGLNSLAISASSHTTLMAGLTATPDAFVAQFNAASMSLSFSTYLGGEQGDNARGVASNRTGIYLAGDTNSEKFPLANPLQSSRKGDPSAFVAKISVTPSPPGKASLISPKETVSTSTPTYEWNAVPMASYYLLWVNDAKTQGKINQWYKASDAGCGSGTGICTISPGSPLADGACQWWIQTWNDYGYGPWSDVLNFRVSTAGPPPKATQISPSGRISISTPTYQWNAAASATWYLLWVNDSKTQAKINQWYKAADAGCVTGTGTCTATPTTPLAAGTCQWWVQTWNDYGVGPWSDGMSFVVPGGGPPDKATLVSPSGNVSTARPAYSWNAVSAASWYLLWVNDSLTQGKINQWYKAADVGCGSGSGTCTVTPSSALAAGACRWWIQTWNDYGYGPWSDEMSFDVPGGGAPGKATLISPSGDIPTANPTYSWEAVPASTWYLLRVVDSTAQEKIKQWYKAEDAGCGSGAGICNAKPSTGLAGGSYQWSIQTWNDYGYGPWSDAMSFVVPAF